LIRVFIEQTRSLTCRDQIQNLQHQTHDLELAKRSTHRLLKSDEHTNSTLARKQTLLENNQLKLHHRIQNLTEQLTNITQQNQTKKRTMSLNILHLEDQQYKITKMKLVLKKMIHLNNNLEQCLRENRLIRINEQEKLRSIKQISFEKRKQIITHTKRLHIFSIDEHHFIDKIIRNSSEILRLNHLFHDSNKTEKVCRFFIYKKLMIWNLLVFSIEFTKEKK
jgi:hypothetical protein